MLRALVLLLLVANVLFGAYVQGLLGFLGLVPMEQREPERLAQQVAPERVQVLNAAPATPAVVSSPAGEAEPDAAPAVAAAEVAPGANAAPPPVAAPVPPPAPSPPPTACWQAGGYNPSQTIVLNAALQNLPSLDKRWSLAETVVPARWIVYLGKFPNAEVVQRRKLELKEAKVEYREVTTPALAPGLALGTYSSEEAAQTALKAVTRAGVRGAKVVQERQEARSVTLKLPAITEAERDQVQGLSALAGKPLQRCP